MIPAQRGAPAGRPAAPKSGEQKPILAPWMKDRAEFAGKVRDVGKRAAHTVGWHLWHALPNALRMLWFAPRGLWVIIRKIWRWVSDAEAGSLRQNAIAKNNMMITSSTQNCGTNGSVGTVSNSPPSPR